MFSYNAEGRGSAIEQRFVSLLSHHKDILKAFLGVMGVPEWADIKLLY